MASFTLKRNDIFPVGTVVGAYPIAQWVGEAVVGNPVNSQTMASGSLTFTGLTDGAEYIAAAQVNGQWKALRFRADVPAKGLPGSYTILPGDLDAATVALLTGPAGPAGLPGPAGGIGIGVDVWNSQGSPGAVTDWGPIINTLVTNGARCLLFGEHDFPFTTPLDFSGTGIHGLILQGAGGREWRTTNVNVPTRLIFKGTGAGRAVDIRSASGVVFRDLGIYYDSASFTGDLIDMSPVTGGGGQAGGAHLIESCTISSKSPANQEARCLVKMQQVNGCYFRDSLFQGAQSLIRGYEVAPVDYSNTHSFEDVVLQSWTNAAFMNIGNEWLLDNVCLEFDACGATARGIGSDIAHTSPSVFTLTGQSTLWDAVAATQVAMKQPVDAVWNPTIEQTTFHSGGRTQADIDLQGPGTVHIEDIIIPGTYGISPIDVGNVVANANARKDRITIRNVTQNGDLDVPVVANLKGHSQVTIEDIGGVGGNTEHYTQLRTTGGYERTLGEGTLQRPTVGLNANSSGLTIQESFGTDMAGVIRVSTSGTPNTGLQLDVTFGVPMLPDYRSASYKTWLAVQLTPLSVATIATDGDVAAGLGLYAQIANAGTDHTVTSTGFSIGFKNAPAASKNFAIAYRVVQL